MVEIFGLCSIISGQRDYIVDIGDAYRYILIYVFEYEYRSKMAYKP